VDNKATKIFSVGESILITGAGCGMGIILANWLIYGKYRSIKNSFSRFGRGGFVLLKNIITLLASNLLSSPASFRQTENFLNPVNIRIVV
jgi:hypothetical protein